MKKLRYIFYIAIAILLLVSVCACAAGDSGTSAGTAPGAQSGAPVQLDGPEQIQEDMPITPI